MVLLFLSIALDETRLTSFLLSWCNTLGGFVLISSRATARGWVGQRGLIGASLEARQSVQAGLTKNKRRRRRRDDDACCSCVFRGEREERAKSENA
jgi:hypothetical protein